MKNGGIIHIKSGTYKETITITHGEAWMYSGGIYHDQSKVTIKNCIITNNRAYIKFMSEGGRIYGYLGFQIYNSIVTNNRCWEEGGGIYSNNPSTVVNTKIKGNIACWEGGGICGAANLEFVKVYNNFALHHGGVTSYVKYDARSKIKYNWFTNT